VLRFACPIGPEEENSGKKNRGVGWGEGGEILFPEFSSSSSTSSPLYACYAGYIDADQIHAHFAVQIKLSFLRSCGMKLTLLKQRKLGVGEFSSARN